MTPAALLVGALAFAFGPGGPAPAAETEPDAAATADHHAAPPETRRERTLAEAEAEAAAQAAQPTAPPARPSLPANPVLPRDPIAPIGRGEVLIDGAMPPRRGRARPVHGEARLELGFGAVMQDPVATLRPVVRLDFAEVLPLQVGVSAPIRFRMIPRAPDQSGVVRARDWDEAGDFVAILDHVRYDDEHAFDEHGWARVDVRAGALRRQTVGHGSIVRDFDNGLDIDRRRTGVRASTRVEGWLADRPAGVEVLALASDVTGQQIVGGRVGLDWVGAGLGLTAFGDPTAPRALARTASTTDPRVERGRAGRLSHTGRRGAGALGVDLSYRATDRWWFTVLPYLDLVWMPGRGGGGHLGTDVDVTVGRRRRATLGATAELTVGGRDYDPSYFDTFYLAQRWQAPFVARPVDRPDDLGSQTLPKYGWVDAERLSGAGGRGALRFAHDRGGFVETGYAYRPGPLGHTFHLAGGVDVRRLQLSLLLAHRGSRHGFTPARAGTVTRVELAVPVIRWVDVVAGAGWLFALRADTVASADPAADPDADTGLVTGAGFVMAGVAGRVPW